MFGASILLLLACGGILAQGRHVNSNSNSNQNIFGRRNSNANVNSNSNTNFLGGRPSPSWLPYGDANDVDEPRVVVLDNVLDRMRRKLYDEHDPQVAAVATAAADAALSVSNTVAMELSRSIALEVAESVAQTIGRRVAYRKNTNTNVNTNTNMNMMGSDFSRGPQHGQESFDLGQEYILPRGSYPPRGRDFRRSANAGPYYDPDEEEEGDLNAELEAVIPDTKDTDVEEEKQAAAARAMGRRQFAARRYGSSTNTNSNTNINSFRRTLNRLHNDPNEDNDLPRRYGSHKNSNINTNTNFNTIRRNLNSNSNNNNFRRNINSNANNNRIGGPNRYRY